MNGRINDKIDEIEAYISKLSEIMPNNIEEYKELKTKAACERYFEMIVEAIVDLAFLIIKERGLKIPNEDKEAFDILAKEKIITESLATRLKEAKGMRNILAHEYGIVDDELVFTSITEEIIEDTNNLLKQINKK